MPIVSIVAFRGTGGIFERDHPHYAEPALVRAGHVALSGIIPDKLIGFSPTPEAIEAVGDVNELLDLLDQGKAQVGCLQDDTLIFQRAKELALTGERTTIWELEVEISEQDLETIKQWYNEKKEGLYAFPNRQGEFKTGQYNCATFLSVLNVAIPSYNGRLKFFIAAMRAKGAKQW